MASSLLEGYEQQYGVITASITARTAKLSSATIGEDRRSVIQHIEKEVEEAKEILEQMGLEARELAAASRTKYQTRIQSYSVELDRLDGDFRKAKTSYYRAREDLLGESDQDYYDGSQKQSLIDNTEKLERGNRRLEVGYKVAIETEQIGNQIMTDLNEQRETIQRTRARLRDTDDELGISGRVLNRMVLRIMQNRLVIVGVVLLILFAIIVGVYFTVRKHNRN